MHRAGEKIKAYRKRQAPPQTQQELADALGISKPWLVRIELYGKIPRADVAQKLADLGACDVADFNRPARAEAVG